MLAVLRCPLILLAEWRRLRRVLLRKSRLDRLIAGPRRMLLLRRRVQLLQWLGPPCGFSSNVRRAGYRGREVLACASRDVGQFA